MKRCVVVAASLAVWTLAANVLGQPITYQGRLDNGGVPASGVYDLEFRLFDMEQGGMMLDQTWAANVQVTNGLFTAYPEFSPSSFITVPYTPPNLPATTRWMEVGARPTGMGTYETLSPRQPVTPAPLAVKSLYENWRGPEFDFASSTTLRTKPGIERAFVNRDTRIDSTDFFGVTIPQDTPGGGINVDNPTDPGYSYYGFASNWERRAFIYYYNNQRGASGFPEGMHFYVGGTDRLSILPSGRLGVGTAFPTSELEVNGTVKASGVVTPAFKYPAVQTRVLTIGPESFRPSRDVPYSNDPIQGRAFINSGFAYLTAPVQLPRGAVLQALTMRYVDSSSQDLLLVFYSRNADSTQATLIAVAGSSGAVTGAVRAAPTSIAPANPERVVSEDKSYGIYVSCDSWNAGGGETHVVSVQISYTVEGPE